MTGRCPRTRRETPPARAGPSRSTRGRLWARPGPTRRVACTVSRMELQASKAQALAPLGDEARQFCQALLRMDTTNPPGNERICAEYVAGLLADVGYKPELLEAAPGRTNVIVRYRGTGAKAPLLLTGHLDVVEADPAQWRRPPFSGEEFEGCLWGRGAIDMKNMVAMCTAIMRRLAATRTQLARDVIFAAVADEEAGCDLGSRFLVEQHRSKVEAEFAIGESGGFSLHLGETTF